VRAAPSNDRAPILDRTRLRDDRGRRLRDEMARRGYDALLLLGRGNVQYATDADIPAADASRLNHFPTIALVLREDPVPHLFTALPDDGACDLPGDHLHEPLLPELESGVAAVAAQLRLLVGASSFTLGLDEMSAAMRFGLSRDLPRATIADASPVTAAARIVKTPDEVECIRRAQHLNELAMLDVQAALVPGIRQCDLSALFLQQVFELGATANYVNPIWQLVPARIADGPFTLTGEVAFPLVSTDRVLAEGDLLWVDTGIGYHGYASDFGRTWVVSARPEVDAPRRAQFRRWREVIDALLATIRPGATGADLTRAAHDAVGDRTPWLRHLYVAHGAGLDSAEMPLVGTDLGEEFDRQIVLAPGMILVLEPVIWDEGVGGYRGEEIALVTDSGYRLLSDYTYAPFN